MSPAPIPHFSKKIFFLSLAFLLAGLGIMFLKNAVTAEPLTSSISPVLHLEGDQKAEVRSAYHSAFTPAQSGMELFSGTTLKTGSGQRAELLLGENTIRLDEETVLQIKENNFPLSATYSNQEPRLRLSLEKGALWVNAFDSIEINSPRSAVELTHASAVITRADRLNRVIVFNGDAQLSLKNEAATSTTEFIVPLHNQVTFLDTQITDNYIALKPSKLRKELKMTPASEEVVTDPWVLQNLRSDKALSSALSNQLIHSKFEYLLKKNSLRFLSWLSFLPEAKEDLTYSRLQAELYYLLGKVATENDSQVATQVIKDLSDSTNQWKDDAAIQTLLTSTLFNIQLADIGSPAFLLREFLIDHVKPQEGPGVMRIYLADLRRLLFEGDKERAKVVLTRWEAGWSEKDIEQHLAEYTRQSQILNHTLLSSIGQMDSHFLDIFDRTGELRMKWATDLEEVRFEVIKERLQLTSTLVNNYQYALAKQYLKNSYQGLDIQEESALSPSAAIFLETGKLLAQRIDYAQKVLRGAAVPIDETAFKQYLQEKARDQAIFNDLERFFEEGQGAPQKSEITPPSPQQVAEKLAQGGIDIRQQDIQLIPESKSHYQLTNARLLDRGSNNALISFKAIYDFQTHSVSQVKVGDQTYLGPFALEDLIAFLLNAGIPNVPSDSAMATQTTEAIDLLISDQGKIEAEEGQLLAQDLAKKLAITKLQGAGLVIPDVNENIKVLDPLNLDQFHITNAQINQPGTTEFISINFDYDAGSDTVLNVKNDDKGVLVDKASLQEISGLILEKIQTLDQKSNTISKFLNFAEKNQLSIEAENAIYAAENQILVTGLTLIPVNLAVNGLFDIASEKFISVSNPLLSRNNLGFKEYFQELVSTHLIQALAGENISIGASQIQGVYPFSSFQLRGVQVGDGVFSFEINPVDLSLRNIKRLSDNSSLNNMTLTELKAYLGQIES